MQSFARALQAQAGNVEGRVWKMLAIFALINLICAVRKKLAKTLINRYDNKKILNIQKRRLTSSLAFSPRKANIRKVRLCNNENQRGGRSPAFGRQPEVLSRTCRSQRARHPAEQPAVLAVNASRRYSPCVSSLQPEQVLPSFSWQRDPGLTTSQA